ncbi:oxidoreductase [Deinococcus maricopensis]|uniref:Probable oxidoreductase n=1 Tax=Deinococcus maricopensis (strain DSM 21211 / LMG 22137 / NRRL B-23946 / LB-34) TaxID=709986 RepID=E8U966_DEIML|nr:oxidoreductase [Deinococcus maricopensis]ADV67605.1 short-chain dehydrogenase/reductase SDR [Deinococcus maricopensis DSM 21211]
MPIDSTFDPRATALDVIAGQDLSGRVALVTGATSGLGVETARALLSAGARVYLAVRDPERGEATADALRSATGNADARVLPLDLTSLASVRAAAQTFRTHEDRLHVLINNAGVMATPPSRTQDGFELQFGTNHLGHHALFTGLLPALRAAAPARVVALSSLAHRMSDVDLTDPNFERQPYDKWIAYARSKTANALFAVGVTARHAHDGVTANAVHPGGILTGLQKFIPEEEQRAMGWMDDEGRSNPRFKTPEQGAATSIWAAVGPELDGVGGLYLEDIHEARPFDPAQPYEGVQPYALDAARAAELWALSERLLGA